MVPVWSRPSPSAYERTAEQAAATIAHCCCRPSTGRSAASMAQRGGGACGCPLPRILRVAIFWPLSACSFLWVSDHALSATGCSLFQHLKIMSSNFLREIVVGRIMAFEFYLAFKKKTKKVLFYILLYHKPVYQQHYCS